MILPAFTLAQMMEIRRVFAELAGPGGFYVYRSPAAKRRWGALIAKADAEIDRRHAARCSR